MDIKLEVSRGDPQALDWSLIERSGHRVIAVSGRSVGLF